MAGKLTDSRVKLAKPGSKRYTLFDTGGLYLEVAPNGGKWWRFRYTYNDKRKVMSLGVYPDISLKAARDKRDTAKVVLSKGDDPAIDEETKSRQKMGPTFAEVTQEWLEFKIKSWSERHTKSVRLRINKYLLPALADKPFSKLAVRDFLPIFRGIEKREKFETARRVAQICHQICRYGRLTELISYNPVEGIAEFLIPSKPEHLKTITDPKIIGCLLRHIQHYPGRPVTGFALKIMPYVFIRSGELRGARWDEIDFKTSTWIIPAERMKKRREHIIPLSTQVQALFEDLKFF